ncbi:sugar transferase [Aestuariivivens insulae]|uniref:sugar transferase n=1 Tax=Aestuariivivens insulae TaxID=1621988 RepID=UPI001F5767BC|nr:sugar transferase [Aestuariivivens insulae]
MKPKEIIIKRIFDIALALLGLLVLGWFILLLIFCAVINTGQQGIFKQKRVGQNGRLFSIYKLRTMKDLPSNDKMITAFGQFLRKMKWDELPQLWNVLKGDMSFVGPRPDVVGYADQLKGEDRIILSVKPGITGLATICFKDEEELLSKQNDPKAYNDKVIWPKKVELNKAYIAEYSFSKDITIIIKTICLSFRRSPDDYSQGD